jgi:hypothetical protein
MRITVLTLAGSRYGLKLLNLLLWDGIPVEQVVILRNRRRLRWARRSARRVGWPVVLGHLLWGLRSPFRRQGDVWRGKRLILDYHRLATRVDNVPSPHAPECLAALQAGRPELLLLAQTGLVPRGVLDIPKLATLNAHPGILPEYRGLDPDRWAIYERRFDRVGCSLHLVEPAIDRGPILEVQPYTWRGDETLDRLAWRLNETCLDLLAGACRQPWPAYLSRAAPQGDGRLYSLTPPWLWPRVWQNLRRFLATR